MKNPHDFRRLLEYLPALRAIAAQMVQEQTLEEDEDRREFMLLVLLLFRQAAEVAAQELVENSITLAEFEQRMARLLKDSLITATAAAHGGDWDAISEVDLVELSAALEEQLEYLHGFAEAIYDKVQSEEELTTAVHARAKMYAGAAWALYWLLTHEQKKEEFSEVLWVLDPPAEHCDDCLELADIDWMPIGDLHQVPADGGTQCLGRCRCHLEYRIFV